MYEFRENTLNRENWEGLSQQIRESYEKDDMIKKWLSGRLNIQKIILDRYWIVGDFQVDEKFFSRSATSSFFLAIVRKPVIRRSNPILCRPRKDTSGNF